MELYVAVGKDVKESESLLLWAIQNSGGCMICIVHVHQPDEFIPILGKKYHCSSLQEQQLRAYRRIERQLMLKTLDEYVQICQEFEVEAKTLYIEMDSVEDGMLRLIAQHNIQKLVMGAAAESSYHIHTNLMEPKSKKAVNLQLHAPPSCHIWYICKGHLVHQRISSSQVSVNTETETSTNSRSPRESERAFHVEVVNGRLTDPPFINNTEVAPGSGTRSHVPTGLSSHVSRESTAKQLEEARKLLEAELAMLKHERNGLREELQFVVDKNSVLERKVANLDQVVKDLEEGMTSTVQQLQICEQERHELRIECDNLLMTTQELLSQSADEAATATNAPKFFTTLSFAAIKEATNDFNASLQLWGGETVSFYRGVISHSQVIVKIWNPEGLEAREFHQEVEILSKFRHPNLVTLMGVCPDGWALVYEDFPNGNLKDRLGCKDNTPPLSWKTRIRIVTEICSALIFLHSRTPLRVIHGSLKSASLFLDSNFTCKIGDFGYSHLILHQESSTSTGLSNSLDHTVPGLFGTGEVNPSVDVYYFGMILLELLTGKRAFRVINEWRDDMNNDHVRSLLDASAGDWPFVQVGQLFHLALRCCDEIASNRPDIEAEIWSILEPMRASCGGSTSHNIGNDEQGSTSHNLGDEEHREAPSYFVCPILQEVMLDPHVAADGYTYEAEALRKWLDTGHDTSPMTNLQLEHCNLVPNHALRSAIQEWQDQH